MKTIGLAYLSKGKQEAAKAHLLRAKDIFETTFSEDHIWVQECRQQLLQMRRE